jgi:hypothetical protein
MSGGGYSPQTLQFEALRYDKTQTSINNAAWTVLYTTNITNAEAVTRRIIVHVQGHGQGSSTGYGLLRVTVDGVQVGQWVDVGINAPVGIVDGSLALVIPLVAGTDFTAGVGFVLAVEGSAGPAVTVYYDSSAIYSDRGI